MKPFSVGHSRNEVWVVFFVLLMLAYRLLSFSEHVRLGLFAVIYAMHVQSIVVNSVHLAVEIEEESGIQEDKTTHCKNTTTLRCFLSFDRFFLFLFLYSYYNFLLLSVYCEGIYGFEEQCL